MIFSGKNGAIWPSYNSSDMLNLNYLMVAQVVRDLLESNTSATASILGDEVWRCRWWWLGTGFFLWNMIRYGTVLSIDLMPSSDVF